MTESVQETKAHGDAIPALGLGTWSMGGGRERDPTNDDARDSAAIRFAVSNGLTHIDTAEAYAAGYTETLVGQAIENFPRGNLFLASKVSYRHLHYDDVLRAFDASLRRLKTDYLDLYYLHSSNPDIPVVETARAFNRLYRAGTIRHIGVCNHSLQEMKELQAFLEAPISVNQSHYNLIYREPERTGLLEYCQTQGIRFTAWSPILWNRSDYPAPPCGNAWDTGLYPILDDIATLYGRPNVQVALNFLLNQPLVGALIKASQIQHLQEILGSLEWRLSPEHLEKLRTQFPDQRTEP